VQKLAPWLLGSLGIHQNAVEDMGFKNASALIARHVWAVSVEENNTWLKWPLKGQTSIGVQTGRGHLLVLEEDVQHEGRFTVLLHATVY